MREIMVRGKRVEYGEMVYGYLIGDDVIVGNIVEFNDEYFNTSFWYKVRPETVGEYTGLKDRNGKEVYEGDIVIVNSSHKALKNAKFEPEKSVVQWRETGACFDMLNTNYLNAERKVGLTFDNGMVDSIEVIGNIYENPELVSHDV